MQLAKSKYWYSVKKLIPGNTYESLLTSYYKIRSKKYRGSIVHCPICEQSFSKFIDEHTCPACGAQRRHRLLYLYLKEKTDFFTSKAKVLHFAPEHCFFRKFSTLDNIEYYAADLNSPRAKLKVDMTNIQYADDYFDIVLSSHVLEHIPDDSKAMSELFRVQKKEGWSIHQAPIDYAREHTFEDPAVTTNEERLQFYGHIDHKRIYGKDYRNRLEGAGFSVTADNYAYQLKESLKKKYLIDADEIIYLCKK